MTGRPAGRLRRWRLKPAARATDTAGMEHQYPYPIQLRTEAEVVAMEQRVYTDWEHARHDRVSGAFHAGWLHALHWMLGSNGSVDEAPALPYDRWKSGGRVSPPPVPSPPIR